ncbi:MAG TPA: hypothetical protein VN408_07900 [Actinoplanes sp.]|nr:hypothetical protein [Actinoplanes sp.]
MERGPLALFGAMVAVGVGPALWLGAQLGAADLGPGQRPAPVDEQFPGVDMDFSGGGAGAGELPTDEESFTTYTYVPQASPASYRKGPRPKPVTSATGSPSPSRPSPVPSASTEPSPGVPVPSASVSAGPSVSAEPEPSESSDPETSASVPPVAEPGAVKDEPGAVKDESAQ